MRVKRVEQRSGVDVTARQAQFIDLLVDGVKPSNAAKLAGYAKPVIMGYRMAREPRIRAAVQTGLMARLQSEVGPLAIKALIDCLQPGKTDTIRLKAADIGLKRLAEMAPEAAAQLADSLSDGDLARTIAELKSAVAAVDRAARQPAMIDITPMAKVEVPSELFD